MAFNFAERKQLWKPALLWLAFLAPFFFLTYGQVNQFTATLPVVNSIVFGWEKHIPFWPWTIVPYWSIDLLYGLSLFICTSKRELTVHGLRLTVASLVACLGFLLFPLRFSFTRPVTEGFFGWLFQQLEQFDLPFNQAPSLHIILLWLLWLRFFQHTPPRWRWLLHSWFALIGLSVLTTWQHHFIDIATGLFAGALISYLLPTNIRWHWQLSQDAKSYQLAKRYLIGSSLCLLFGYLGGGGYWLLLWPAFCLTMIALGYIALGVDVFQKNRAGLMSPSARLLLAPYQLGSWLSFRYFRRKTPLVDQIVPGIYLGSFPCQPPEVDAVLDMTSDWPRSRASRACLYIACPRLDLVAPSVTELQEGVDALAELEAQGTVLVHCALGLSRSAIVVVAWLIATNRADNMQQALSMVRTARPNVILHEGHLHILQLWQQSYLKEQSYLPEKIDPQERPHA